MFGALMHVGGFEEVGLLGMIEPWGEKVVGGQPSLVINVPGGILFFSVAMWKHLHLT